MQNFIRLQSILSDPKSCFLQFKTELQKSNINQLTYLCLFLNMAATIKRPTFDFASYMDLLLNFGKVEGRKSASINYTGYKDKISILMNACQKSSASTVRCLTSHPEIRLHIKDPNEMNALFYVIKNTDQNQGLKMLEIFNEISTQLIDISIKNNFSPLFFAVERFKLKIVQYLLKNGVDPNQKLISSGNTPLHEFMKISTKYNLEEVRKLLQIFFRYGFNIETRNNDNKTIIQYAEQMRFNISQLITEIESKRRNYQFYAWSEDSQTQQMTSKKCSTTKLGDNATNDNYSQFLSRQQSDICVRSDFQSRSIKSQLSQNHNFNYNTNQIQMQMQMTEKEFSVGMSQIFSPYYEVEQQNNFQSFCNNYEQTQKNIHQKSQGSGSVSVSGSKKSQKHFKSQPSHSEDQNSYDNEERASQQQSEQFFQLQDINYMKLHNELIEFNQISREIYTSAWGQIQPFINKLAELADQYSLKLQLIGSFATGLWTYHSDIDIALVVMNDIYVDFQKILQKVYNKLKTQMYKYGVKQISISRYNKVPSIKIQMDQYLYSSLKIQIYVFHRKNTGKAYVNYITEALRFYPEITPIFFTIKRVCEQFELHDPLQGGLKTYTLFLMIYSIVQTVQSKNLGQIIYRICLYYGFYFQYEYDFEQKVNKDKIQWSVKTRLNIGDPLNSKNNMGGKNTDGIKVQKMFRTMFYSLHKNITQGTTLQYILELAQVL